MPYVGRVILLVSGILAANKARGQFGCRRFKAGIRRRCSGGRRSPSWSEVESSSGLAAVSGAVSEVANAGPTRRDAFCIRIAGFSAPHAPPTAESTPSSRPPRYY
ncbi:hypothetical protein GGR56DRAFT_374295 [Xylariaceae sp. FL0804]|nr:hypothetical protein GGR56DRAFT_374295 [Xylariaceae sp. FL0804]